MSDVFFDVWNEKGVFVARLVVETRMPKVPASEVAPWFERHLREGGSAHVIFDLNQAAYLSSWCLGAMLKTFKASFTAKGRRIICNYQDEIRDSLEIIRLHRYIVFSENLETALALLTSGDNDPPSGSLVPFNS